MSIANIYRRHIPKGSCLAFQTVTADFCSNWHAHAEFEIVYIESGWGCIQYGEEQRAYTEGDILVLGPWVPHEFLEKSKNHHSISLLFDYSFLSLGEFDCALTQSIRQFLNKAINGMIFREAMHHTEIDIIKLIVAETGLEQAINLLFLLKKMAGNKEVNLLYDKKGEHSQEIKQYAKLQDILYYINNHCSQELTTQLVAENFYMSRSHFSRLFNSQVGQSFSSYLLTRRIESACRLLRQTDMSITHISEEVGFKSLSSFNRGFLKLHGCAPRDYRMLKRQE